MVYEHSVHHTEISFQMNSQYKRNKEYFIAYLDSDETIKTVCIKLEKLYIEDSGFDYNNKQSTISWVAKILFKKIKYKTFIHKFFKIKHTEWCSYNKYVNVSYIKETEPEAKIAFLDITNLIKDENIKTILEKEDTKIALEFPDLYLRFSNTSKIKMLYLPDHQNILEDTATFKNPGIQQTIILKLL